MDILECDDKEDRISVLPDSLILEILFLLPEKEAIRTSCLSKRWQHLWTFLPNLIFIINPNQSRSHFFSFVDKTITQSPRTNVTKFQLHTSYDSTFQSLVNKWLRYVRDHNVEEIDLSLLHDGDQIIVLDDLFFVNSSLTSLKLSCDFVNPTTGLFRWTNLKSLSLTNKSDLYNDSLENILSGTPHLETFELNECYGFTIIDLRVSNSVKSFVISGCKRLSPTDYGYVELYAPHILSLTVAGALAICSLDFDHLSSLVEAKFSDHVHDKDGHIPFISEYEEQDMLKARIQLLSECANHEIKLHLGIRCKEVLSILEAEDFVLPWNIKVVDGEFY